MSSKPQTSFYSSGRKKLTKKVLKENVAKSVKAIVNSAIARNSEDKSFQVYRPSVPIVSYNHANFNSYIFPVSPFAGYCQIDQGTGAGNRIGNKIKLKKVKLGLIIYPLPYNVSTNPTPQPVEIRMWLLYDKENPLIVPSLDASFCQLGNSAQALTSQLNDMVAPVNTDRWRVMMSRTFKVGFANFEGSGVSTAQPYFQNNDFKLNIKRTYDITDHLIKNVQYNDNSSDPMTRGLFAVFEAVNADGTTTAATSQMVQMSYTLDCHYED